MEYDKKNQKGPFSKAFDLATDLLSHSSFASTFRVVALGVASTITAAAIGDEPIKKSGDRFAPAPTIGGAPMGLSSPSELTERRDPKLSKDQLEKSLDTIRELAAKDIIVKYPKVTVTYPGLGRTGTFSDDRGVSLSSFDEISDDVLNEMKKQIVLASGYKGNIKLQAPSHITGPTYSGPTREYQHLVILDDKQKQIGVLKFTEPVSIKFIPQVDAGVIVKAPEGEKNSEQGGRK